MTIGSGWPGRSGVLLSVLVALLAGVMAGCGDDDSAGPEAGVTLEQVADEEQADALLGTTVSVSGAVDEIVDDRSFVLGANLDERLLVLTDAPYDAALVDEGAVVEVTGTVGQLVLAEAEEDLDFDFDDEALVEFEEQNYLVAEEVAPAPEEAE